MRLRSGLLIVVAVTALSGCRVFDRWSRDRDRPSADPASRGRDRAPRLDDPARPPKNWLDAPGTPAAGVRVPPADSWADARDPKFDARTASQRIISGVLEDPDGKRVADAYVTIEPADPAAGAGAPVGVQTDPNGYFVFPGLRAGQTYVITAQVKGGGRALSGRQYVRVPNRAVRLQVRDDLTLAPVRRDDLPPGGAAPAVPSPPATGGVQIPSVFDSPPTPPRDAGTLPYPAEHADGDRPVAPRPVPPRPDLMTTPHGKDWNGSPPVNIPGPGTTSRVEKDAGEFTLVSAAGRRRAFPSGRDGGLVLLDFMTTTCGPCRKAVPTLTALQAKYERHGLEVVGVVCDGEPERQRRELAAAYQDGHRLNYGLYVEPGAVGRLQDRFRVDRYPTLVLIDGTGRTLWRGHPKDAAELEQVIREAAEAHR